MFVVDTNILVYAVFSESVHHVKARQCLERWRRECLVWHSTWGIFYEFLRVSTHRAISEKPLLSGDARQFLEAIAISPGFSLLVETESHALALDEVLNSFSELSGNIWHDAHTVALMKEHGVQTVMTADTDFHRFRGIKVVNPL